jgi:hypothetical protein
MTVATAFALKGAGYKISNSPSHVDSAVFFDTFCVDVREQGIHIYVYICIYI